VKEKLMDLGLDGKVAVVTGAGKGIGLAVTRALAAEGAQVVAGSRSTGTLEGLKGVTPVAVDPSAFGRRDSSAPAMRNSPGRCR
jgi:NAD(P)-dependent dehydrogenase (short-subunit alcohol dehydrogenase family)